MTLRQLALAWALFLLLVVAVPMVLGHVFPAEDPCPALMTYNGGLPVC